MNLDGRQYRILVTGSREWPTDLAGFVTSAIDTVISGIVGTRTIIVVHGACPSGGVDTIADQYVAGSTFHRRYDAYGLLLYVERHPADWNLHAKAAGPLRNTAMVALGADVCLAFPASTSRGTLDCLSRAIRAGIPTYVFPLEHAHRMADAERLKQLNGGPVIPARHVESAAFAPAQTVVRFS